MENAAGVCVFRILSYEIAVKLVIVLDGLFRAGHVTCRRLVSLCQWTLLPCT